MWSVMERVNTLNACHFFIACRPDRPKESYTIDFSSNACENYVPRMRLRSGVKGTEITQPNGRRIGLDPTQLAFVQHIDGQRTVQQITERIAQSGILPQDEIADVEELGRTLIQALWQGDYLDIAFNTNR